MNIQQVKMTEQGGALVLVELSEQEIRILLDVGFNQVLKNSLEKDNNNVVD